LSRRLTWSRARAQALVLGASSASSATAPAVVVGRTPSELHFGREGGSTENGAKTPPQPTQQATDQGERRGRQPTHPPTHRAREHGGTGDEEAAKGAGKRKGEGREHRPTDARQGGGKESGPGRPHERGHPTRETGGTAGRKSQRALEREGASVT
jgi:hypothetical protein